LTASVKQHDRATTKQPSRPASNHRVDQTEAPEPAVGLPIDRAEAMLPADLLQGGEIIILILKPSPLFIVLGALGHLTAIVLVCLLAAWSALLTREAAMLAGIGLGSLRLGWQFLEWLSRVYVLTDRRVIRIAGVLRIFVFEAALKQIQHTDLVLSIRERLFGLGTIAFSTAGTGAAEAFWVMLHRPMAVHRRIIQAINRYGQ